MVRRAFTDHSLPPVIERIWVASVSMALDVPLRPCLISLNNDFLIPFGELCLCFLQCELRVLETPQHFLSVLCRNVPIQLHNRVRVIIQSERLNTSPLYFSLTADNSEALIDTLELRALLRRCVVVPDTLCQSILQLL